jgi:glycosyltransferase involved in cell wall biosynthesis
MRVGIAIDDTWAFLNEIYADLEAHHQTTLYQPRPEAGVVFLNRWRPNKSEQEFRRFLRDNQVVFFEWATGLLQAACQLPKTCGIVTRIHRYELYDWADQINWEPVDRVILVSEAKQRQFHQRFPAHASKTVVIPEAIPVEKFEYQPKAFNGDIGILCHISPRKRVYELILAFNELVRQDNRFHLHIGGGKRRASQDYFDALHRLVERLGLQDKVTFYGKIEDPQTWYHRIDIFISNSYSEGLQVSPMEAIASGCYCLSHWWDGAEELLPESNLYYGEAELIRGIRKYADLCEEERMDAMAELHERILERFDMNKIKLQIREQIEQVGASFAEKREA